MLQVVSFLIIGMLVKTLAPYFAVTELLLVRFGFTFAVLLAVIGPKRGPSFLKTRYPIDHPGDKQQLPGHLVIHRLGYPSALHRNQE